MLVFLSAIAAVVPILFYLFLIWRFDMYDREPVMLVLMNYFWGALAAVILTFSLNTIFGYFFFDVLSKQIGREILTNVITAPIFEEIAKGFFLFIMINNKKFDNLTDGIVYGGAIGLGFGMTENFLYFLINSSSLQTWFIVVIIRTLFSAVMHCVATGTLGAVLGFAKFKKKAHKILFSIFGLIIAVLIHAAWNGFVSYESTYLIGMIFMIFTIAIFISTFALSINSERKMIFNELMEESRQGLIPLPHAAILISSLRKRKGWVDESIRKPYISFATRLAFTKILLKNSEGTVNEYYLAEITNLREKISNMLQR